MKQLEIHITDTNGKDWGNKKITLLNWQRGEIRYIEVDWYEIDRDNMSMYLEADGYFKNTHQNLIGKIIYNKNHKS